MSDREQPPNVWCLGPIDENPYRRTAFRLARVTPNDVERSRINRLVTRTRRVVRADPGRSQAGGRPVTEADVNKAEAILLDAERRILEELIEHAPECVDVREFSNAESELDDMLNANADLDRILTAPFMLLPFIDEVVRTYVDAAGALAIPFGALELEPPPPFGWREDPMHG